MKTKVAILFLLLNTSVAYSSIVELPLACEGLYTGYSTWEGDFDFEVTFQEITNANISWTGEITAGLYRREDETLFPNLLLFSIMLTDHSGNFIGYTHTGGGQKTYPESESFDDCLLEFWHKDFKYLLDGQGHILIRFDFRPPPSIYECIEEGSVLLHKASLVVKGTIIPEPATVLLLGLGAVMLRKKR